MLSSRYICMSVRTTTAAIINILKLGYRVFCQIEMGGPGLVVERWRTPVQIEPETYFFLLYIWPGGFLESSWACQLWLGTYLLNRENRGRRSDGLTKKQKVCLYCTAPLGLHDLFVYYYYMKDLLLNLLIEVSLRPFTINVFNCLFVKHKLIVRKERSIL